MSGLTDIARAWAALVARSQRETGAVDDDTQPVASHNDKIDTEDRQFRKYIEVRKNLPDAFLGRDVYIYLHLIKPWFKFLCLKHRCDDDKIQTFQEAYFTYIRHMKDITIYRFLFVKSGVSEGDGYITKYECAKQGKEQAEDFFANALGDEAVQLLLSIRRLSYRCFNRNGDKAPEGYQYNRLETDIQKIEA